MILMIVIKKKFIVQCLHFQQKWNTKEKKIIMNEGNECG